MFSLAWRIESSLDCNLSLGLRDITLSQYKYTRLFIGRISKLGLHSIQSYGCVRITSWITLVHQMLRKQSCKLVHGYIDSDCQKTMNMLGLLLLARTHLFVQYTCINNLCSIHVSTIRAVSMYQQSVQYTCIDNPCSMYVSTIRAVYMYQQSVQYTCINNPCSMHVSTIRAVYMYQQSVQYTCINNPCSIHVSTIRAVYMYQHKLHLVPYPEIATICLLLTIKTCDFFPFVRIRELL